MINFSDEILKSLQVRDNANNSLDDILSWIKELNEKTLVNLTKVSMEECRGWGLNSQGLIQNEAGTFFKIAGLRFENNGEVVEQPILLQDEIGFLGILTKKINGVLHFLMQAKIEPGNLNNIQISPTIQATKSNFLQKHGGKKPKYLEFFQNSKEYKIVYDQIQSEQSSRFFGKRNRNIIVYLGEDEDVYVEKNWKWMTLGQIKELLRHDNLVNMDSRTVLSGLPLFLSKDAKKPTWFKDGEFFEMITDSDSDYYTPIYNQINDYKMFSDINRTIVPLTSLKDWRITKDEIIHKESYSFKVVFYEIEIEGREVRKWYQPLFQAIGKAKFILLTAKNNGKMMFLVKTKKEIGAFDNIEIGPTVQKEAIETDYDNPLEKYVFETIQKGENIITNVTLSEEGGRFYHEENINIILESSYDIVNEVISGLEEYFWIDYQTLIKLMRVNNVLNIQLRNLLSLLDIKEELR